MTTRFDVERVVCASDLPPSERLVLFVLLQHADNDPVIISAKFTPSLSGLASETGLDRTTVARILSRWSLRDGCTGSDRLSRSPAKVSAPATN